MNRFAPTIMTAIPIAAVMGFAFGPHELSDWFWRPLFVQVCTSGAGGRTDDAVLQRCNDAYWQRVSAQERGWRPERGPR